MNKKSSVYLSKMTKELNRQFWHDFQHDPCMFRDLSKFQLYRYTDESADASWERQKRLGRVHLAIMLGTCVVGEIVLKDFDTESRSCTLGIHLQNDTVKDKGYGTAAELLVLDYAFNTLDIETVFADSLHQNTRSQHVLKKVGFVETHKDNTFRYYRCDRTSWTATNQDKQVP